MIGGRIAAKNHFVRLDVGKEIEPNHRREVDMVPEIQGLPGWMNLSDRRKATDFVNVSS
jgi:hypothetical protein